MENPLDYIPEFTKRLSVRQSEFIDAFIANKGNASRAAIAAGYSEVGARVQGSRLLADPNIRAAIDKKLAITAAAAGLTIERVQAEIARNAFADPRRLVDPETGKLKPLHELDDDTAATIASIENEELFEGSGKDRERVGTLVKVKTNDKMKALELAGRHLGMFTEKVDVRVGIGILVIHE